MISPVLAFLLATTATPPPASAPPPATVDAKDRLEIVEAAPGDPVHLNIEHGLATDHSGPAFEFAVDGWTTDGFISVYLIGPKGEIVVVVPQDVPAQVKEGRATFLIPYGLRGLYPGQWMLLAKGQPGVHAIQVQVPRVELPDKQHRTNRLVFPDAKTQAASASSAADSPAASPSR